MSWDGKAGAHTGGTHLGPLGHTVVSAGIGAGVWATTGSLMAIPAAAATGVLLDVDHALDFYYWFVKKDTSRLFLLFHGWEYAVIGMALIIAAWDHPVLVAGVLGLLGHLLGDQIANKPAHPLAYSLIYRARSHFGRPHIFRETPSTLSEALHKSIPLWRLIEPRLLSVAARFQGESR